MILAYAARSQVKTSVRIGTASLPLRIWSAPYSNPSDLYTAKGFGSVTLWQKGLFFFFQEVKLRLEI